MGVESIVVVAVWTLAFWTFIGPGLVFANDHGFVRDWMARLGLVMSGLGELCFLVSFLVVGFYGEAWRLEYDASTMSFICIFLIGGLVWDVWRWRLISARKRRARERLLMEMELSLVKHPAWVSAVGHGVRMVDEKILKTVDRVELDSSDGKISMAGTAYDGVGEEDVVAATRESERVLIHQPVRDDRGLRVMYMVVHTSSMHDPDLLVAKERAARLQGLHMEIVMNDVVSPGMVKIVHPNSPLVKDGIAMSTLTGRAGGGAGE